MTYYVKPDFLAQWGATAKTVITEDVVRRRSSESGVPQSELLKQLTPITKEESDFNATLELMRNIWR